MNRFLLFALTIGLSLSSAAHSALDLKSKALLRQPGVPIAEIAGLCGFEDQSYFTRVFKKQTGISPKQYRNNALEEL